MTQAHRRRDEAILQAISGALARIQTGSYGECIQCDEDIDFQRLEIAPESPVCVACRRQSERR